MKTTLIALAVGALLTSAASAQSFYDGTGTGYAAGYGPDDTINGAGPVIRRSNLNPRDPAYAGSVTFGYEGYSD